MVKELTEELKKKLEPSIQNYETSTKRTETSLAQMLQQAEEDMVTSKVELEKNRGEPVLEAVLERQHAFRLGMFEHLKGLHQTAADEETWLTDAKVKTRLGVEPDLTPPPWMAGVQQQQQAAAAAPPAPPNRGQQQQQQRPQRRASRYPAMAMSIVMD